MMIKKFMGMAAVVAAVGVGIVFAQSNVFKNPQAQQNHINMRGKQGAALGGVTGAAVATGGGIRDAAKSPIIGGGAAIYNTRERSYNATIQGSQTGRAHGEAFGAWEVRRMCPNTGGSQ